METKNTKNVSICGNVYIFAALFYTPALHDERERQLISEALKHFMTYGIKSMTMDDMARHMRISKKTLYQYVKDKNDLVNKCLEFDCAQSVERVKQITQKHLNAIDEKFEISSMVVHTLKGIHPSIFYDLEKYHPDAMQKLHRMHFVDAQAILKSNFERGVREGWYRDDFNIDILTRLWVSRLNIIFDPSMFPLENFKLEEVYREMFIHEIRGVASKKGLDYLETKLKQLNR